MAKTRLREPRFWKAKKRIKHKLYGLGRFYKKIGNKDAIQKRLDEFFKEGLDIKKFRMNS